MFLLNIQNRVLKIVKKASSTMDETPLSVRQTLCFIFYYYEDLKKQYLQSESTTRNKSLI